MAVAHEGGIFVTRTLSEEDSIATALKRLNGRVLESFGLLRGVSHTEFIRGEGGQLYFSRPPRASAARSLPTSWKRPPA
jgi:hypothetical protein